MPASIKTKVTGQTLSSEIDLFEGQKLDSEAKGKIQEQVGEFIVEQINSYLSDAKSPVTGSGFKKLSKNYKKFKEDEGLAGNPDLEFTGQMKDQISFKPTSKGIQIGVFGNAAPRADGHNNFSGESKIPLRQFLPRAGETFTSQIDKEVSKIINDVMAENVNITRSNVAEIRDEKSLFSVLENFFPDLTTNEIIDTVLRNDEMRTLLDEFNLLRFLNG